MERLLAIPVIKALFPSKIPNFGSPNNKFLSLLFSSRIQLAHFTLKWIVGFQIFNETNEKD